MCKTYVQKTRSAAKIEGTIPSLFENTTAMKQGNYNEYYTTYYKK